jgi:hypothetical protein
MTKNQHIYEHALLSYLLENGGTLRIVDVLLSLSRCDYYMPVSIITSLEYQKVTLNVNTGKRNTKTFTFCTHSTLYTYEHNW